MKKYITDVFNDLSESTEKTFCGYTISKNMDELARERVYRTVMQNINAHQCERVASIVTDRPKFKKIAVTAVCIVVVSMGAVGVGASKLYKGFSEYNPSYTETQKAAVEKASYVIGKTISGEGVSITATEAMFDGDKLFLMLETTIDPDKISVESGRTFGCNVALHMTGDPNDTQGFPAQYHKVLARKGNTCTELVVFDAGDLKNGDKVALSAWGLGVLGGETPEDVLDENGGVWAVDMETKIGNGCTFDYKKGNFAKTFSSERGVKQLGMDAKILGGYIAPWYAQFDLIVESDEESILTSIFNNKNTPSFKVVMKDGTIHAGTGIDCGGSAGGADNGTYAATFNFRCSFNEYVETSEIDHVEVNGSPISLC